MPQHTLADITCILAQSGALAQTLVDWGARIMVYPAAAFSELDDCALLDQALENLFGYDWLIFPTPESAEFFLRRFAETGHEVSELDNLRVCAGDNETSLLLADAHIHVDAVPPTPAARDLAQAIQDYLGGAVQMALLNCLIPCAFASRNDLPQILDDLDARADPVPAYRAADGNERARLEAMLNGGGVDCAVFTNAQDLTQLSRLFATHDLSGVLANVIIAVPPGLENAVTAHGLAAHILHEELAPAIVAYFTNT